MSGALKWNAAFLASIAVGCLGMILRRLGAPSFVELAGSIASVVLIPTCFVLAVRSKSFVNRAFRPGEKLALGLLGVPLLAMSVTLFYFALH